MFMMMPPYHGTGLRADETGMITHFARVADAAKHYRNMGVTYSSAGEYGNAIDILPPA